MKQKYSISQLNAMLELCGAAVAVVGVVWCSCGGCWSCEVQL